MLLVDDLAAGGTKNLRHTPRGLVTLLMLYCVSLQGSCTNCSIINYLHPGKFSSAYIFQYQLFQKIISGIHSECLIDWTKRQA